LPRASDAADRAREAAPAVADPSRRG